MDLEPEDDQIHEQILEFQDKEEIDEKPTVRETNDHRILTMKGGDEASYVESIKDSFQSETEIF